MPMRPVDALLARFPGPVALPASRLKLGIAFVFLAGLAVFCVAVLVPRLPDAGWYDAVMTVASSVLISGLALWTAYLLVRPGAVGLRLTADCFEIATFFARRRTRWREVSGFRVERDDGGIRLVHCDVPDPKRRGATIARTLPFNLPLSTDDLAVLMNAWRERALEYRPPTGPHIALRE